MHDTTIDLPASGMLALTRDALASLRASLLRDAGDAAAGTLQEAGYAGGASLYAAFSNWLAAQGLGAPDSLSIHNFQRHAADFFRAAGWGTLEVSALHDTVAMLASSDWGEADGSGALPQPSCHLSSGMFADFFGRVADAPLAVMEVECRSSGAGQCRFLLGSTEVMTQVYEEMARGATYDAAVSAAA